MPHCGDASEDSGTVTQTITTERRSHDPCSSHHGQRIMLVVYFLLDGFAGESLALETMGMWEHRRGSTPAPISGSRPRSSMWVATTPASGRCIGVLRAKTYGTSLRWN